MKTIIKRDGSKVEFNKQKIIDAILKSMKYGSGIVREDIAYKIAENSCQEFKNLIPTVSQIETFVYKSLIELGQIETAKSYEGFRAVQEFKRDTHPLDDSILGLVNQTNLEVMNENSNKQSILASTQRDLIAGEVSKFLSKTKKIPTHIIQAHMEGIIKLHDLDYFLQPITNCIEENGWIYYKDEDGVKHIQLKELKNMFDLTDGVYKINKKCFVLGRNGWTRLKAISLRKTNDEDNMYIFNTRTGMKLKATDNHRIPVIRNGVEKVVYAKDIVKQDILLTSNGLSINPYEYDSKDYINLLDLEDDKLCLRIINIIPLQNYIKYKYETTLQHLLGVCGVVENLTIKQFKTLLSKIEIPYELFFKLKLKAKGSKTPLPLIIPVNESLAKLYGYVYADGGVYINDNQSIYSLTFTNTNTDLIDDFRKCFEDCFDFMPSRIKPSGTSPCWRATVGSRIIVKLFKDFADGKFNGSADISIPNFIMNGSRETKLAFLSSIMDCDGCLGNEQMTYTSCSFKYTEQIVFLLKELGYKASYSKKDSKGSEYHFKHFNGLRNYDSYIIRISRKEDIYRLYQELSTFKRNQTYDEYENFQSQSFIESKILDIQIKKENTYVYDLQTESGWFVVNDYVVHNCELVPLKDMFTNGTVINKKMIETPKSLQTAITLATQIATQVSSFTYGGQTMSVSHLAPYVRVSYNKFKDEVKQEGTQIGIEYEEDQVSKIAKERLKREIKNGVQTFNYQLSTMNSTNGQSPFLSLFMYLNEEPEYIEETAMLIEEFLKQRIEGMKNEYGVSATQTFPKLLFVLDENNKYKVSKYYYLKKLSVKATAIRMNPDYISAKKMKEVYGYVFPCMGCRSFLFPMFDDGNAKFYGRGNLGVTTINLPDVALSSKKNNKLFWDILKNRLENIVKPSLILRYEKLRGVKASVAPILWQHGVFSRLQPDEDVLKAVDKNKFSLSIGYSGLYETVKYMIGESQTTPKGFEFAQQIMKYLYDIANEWKEETGLGFSIYGSPQESTTGWFSDKLKAKFGEVEDITDKGWVTNSYHIDIREPINAFDKLAIEGELQKYSTGGNVSYVEVYNMEKNLDALEQVIDFMYDNNVYAEINSESDVCGVCKYTGVMDNDQETLEWICPCCGNKDQSKLSVVRRTCGYLGETTWSKGRMLDILNRVKHL